jgi:hypothetical protein
MLKRFTRIAAALAIVAVLTAGSLAKAEIVVQDAGFESNTGVPPTDWTSVTDAAAIVNDGGTFQEISAEGSNIAYVNAHYNGTLHGLYQALASTFTVGESYKLTVGVAAADFVSGKGYTSPATDHPLSTMEIRLYWDNGGTKTIIGSKEIVFGDLSTSSLTDYSVTIPTVQSGDFYKNQAIGVWIQTTYQMTSEGVDPHNTYWLVDNVRVTEAIPEPSTIVLLAAGLLGLLAYAWRRRR